MSPHLGRETFHLMWDASIPPALSVPSGSTVSFDVLDASNGQITPESTAVDLADLDFSRVDQVAGPVFVEGAEPGDVLEVELLELRPADWGWTACIPGFGLLADEFPEPRLRITRLVDGLAPFLPGVRIPLAPFCGVLGVAPAGEPRSTIPPTETGGNMDTRHLVAGARLWLPVQVPGALFSLGDGHAAQGDGEVCGTAIETPMQAQVRLTVRKDVAVAAPEFETAGPLGTSTNTGSWLATDGIGPDLFEAARAATRRMIERLGVRYSIAPQDAYMLISVAGDLRISEIVDQPNWIVTCYVPNGIFG
ncbi:MAG TPA: acetamidase/formamidase family protein [Candidatus Limnocylindrales bacterium]|nr:acetamidase/formamidase family protein [Candidatus Limnocylindrales bacterium]